MAKANSSDNSNARKIADAFKGGQEAREDLRIGQSRINRSAETQAAVDEFFGDAK